jgi:ketosteroid isomerase-like protein
MRTHSLFVVTILLAAACQPAAPPVDLEAELAAIEARSAGVIAAETAMDTEAALAFWAPDAIAQAPGAPQAQGTEALRQMYDAFWPQIAAFTSTTTATDIAASGDMAWEYGVNYITIAGPEGEFVDVGKYIGVWRKMDGEWFLAAVAFSSDAPMLME